MKWDVVHFNQRIANILQGPLDPGNSPRGMRTFPPGVPNEVIRTHDEQDPVEWARGVYNVAEEACQQRKLGNALDQLALLPNLLFVAEVKWSSPRSGQYVLDEVHCHSAIFGGATVEGVIVDRQEIPKEKVTYLRADFEPRNLGQYVFPDAVPHAHARNKGEPRFPVSLTPTAPHVDFIELLLRNYARGVWDEWADRVWHRRVVPTLSGPTRGSDPLPRIRAAFREGKYEEIASSLREPVRLWKQALQAEKVQMSSLVRDDRCDDISY